MPCASLRAIGGRTAATAAAAAAAVVDHGLGEEEAALKRQEVIGHVKSSDFRVRHRALLLSPYSALRFIIGSKHQNLHIPRVRRRARF